MRTELTGPPRSLLRPRDLWRAVAIGAVAIFVLRLAYFLFLDLSEGHGGVVAERVFNELTGGLLALIPLGGLAWLAPRVPLVPPVRRKTVAVYVLAFLALSAVHTAAMIVVRAALAPLVGLHGYSYAFSPSRFAYEATNAAAFCIAAVALLALAESVLLQRERERRASALERELLRAELGNLRLQLQPHFLFNALNTISSAMYEDVDRADALLGQLAELLRTSLRSSDTQEVPARDELEVLAQYLDLMRARFGDRLQVSVDAADDVGGVLVPSMILQPLVENAVRHGGVTTVGQGRIQVSLRRDLATDTLELRVQDAPTRHAGPDLDLETTLGTGLSVTARRLQLLYGDAGSMRAGASPDGGFEVVVRIPARSESAAPSPHETLGAPPRVAEPAR